MKVTAIEPSEVLRERIVLPELRNKSAAHDVSMVDRLCVRRFR